LSLYGFGRNDTLEVSGLHATSVRIGQDTLINNAGGQTIGILKGYARQIGGM
jgi:hypothetical protein